MSFLNFDSIFSHEDERARQDREEKQRQRKALQDAAHFRQQAEQITLPFQAEVFRREADAKIKGLELRLNQDKASKEGLAFRQFADQTIAKGLGGLFGGDSELRSRRQEAEAARNQSALDLNVAQQGGSGYYRGNERLTLPTVPPDLSDTGQAFGAGQVPGMVQRSGIQTTPEEIARLQRFGPGVAQGLIEQGNIGPVTDIGAPHTGPEGARLPVVGDIPGFRTLPEAAATLGTAGLGTGSALMKAGMLGGGTGGGYAGREVAGTPGEIVGTLGGALVGGAVAPKIGRALTETIQARPGGLMNEAGGTQLGHTGFPSTWQDELRNGITAARDQIDVARPAIRQEAGQRIGSYEDEFQRLLSQGKPREEAQRMASSALKGDRIRPEAIKLDISDGTREEIWKAIDAHDFGRGRGADYERFRTRSALMKMAAGENVPENELASLSKVIGEENGAALRELQQTAKRLSAGEKVLEATLVPKAVLSSFDVSYPLRQGMMLGPRHPVEFLRNIPRAIKAWGSETYAQSVQRSILDDMTPIPLKEGGEIPFAQWVDEDGLIRSLDGGLSSSEEVFRSSMAERIPFLGKAVRASNRSFVTYGNKLRADVARNMLKTWQRSGNPPSRQELSALSDMLNRFSGRGTLSPASIAKTDIGKRFTDMMQGALWAPQYRVAGPEAVAQIFNVKNPRIAREAFQNFMTYFAAGSGLLAMAKASGAADVQLDPRSTDFGKVKIGNTRFNFWATNQLLARSIAQIATDKRFDPNLGIVPLGDRSDVAWRYLRSGLAPEWGLIVDWVNGESYIGESSGPPTTPGALWREVKERLMPLVAQDIYDAAANGSPLTAAVVAPGALFGASFQTYEPSASQGLGAIPEFKGLEPRDIYDMNQFYNRVDAQMGRWREQGALPEDLRYEDAIRYVAEQDGKGPNFTEWAVRLRPGSKTRAELRNPDWIKYVVEHRDELERNRPYLYDRGYIQDAIAEATASSTPTAPTPTQR